MQSNHSHSEIHLQELRLFLEEIWDEERLSGLINSHFDTKLDSVSSADAVIELRTALTRAKGRYAFGSDWTGSELQTHLLWHFGFWRLKQLRETNGLLSRAILPPGMYREVAVLIADLCSFSSYGHRERRHQHGRAPPDGRRPERYRDQQRLLPGS